MTAEQNETPTTVVPSGTCLSHGSYVGHACPYCCTAVISGIAFALWLVVGLFFLGLNYRMAAAYLSGSAFTVAVAIAWLIRASSQ